MSINGELVKSVKALAAKHGRDIARFKSSKNEYLERTYLVALVSHRLRRYKLGAHWRTGTCSPFVGVQSG
jgi:hypothetical protein